MEDVFLRLRFWFFIEHVSSTLVFYSHSLCSFTLSLNLTKNWNTGVGAVIWYSSVFCANFSQQCHIQQTWQNNCHFPTWNLSFVCAQDVDAFQQQSCILVITLTMMVWQTVKLQKLSPCAVQPLNRLEFFAWQCTTYQIQDVSTQLRELQQPWGLGSHVGMQVFFNKISRCH